MPGKPGSASAASRRRDARVGSTASTAWCTARLPGRVDPNQTTFASVADLASAFRRAEAAHGEYEKRALAGVRDANWPDWYAEYIAADEQQRERSMR